MNGTSIVSLPAEENMFAYDSISSTLPFDFVAPPFLNDNGLYQFAEQNTPRKEIPFFQMTEPQPPEIDQFSPTIASFLPQNLEPSYETMAFPAPNLPRSTAAELWFPMRDQQEDVPFQEEDSEESMTSSSSSNAVEESDSYLNSEAYIPPVKNLDDLCSPHAALQSQLGISGGGDSIPIIPSSKALKPRKRIKVKREVPPQDIEGYRKITPKHTPGKKPKLKMKWTLMCGHCGKIFNARPTPKNSRYVVNHMCPKHQNKRKQFVIGTKARRCDNPHDGPCIQQLQRIGEWAL